MQINKKLIGGGLHYLAILLIERREVFSLYNTSTSFIKAIGDCYG